MWVLLEGDSRPAEVDVDQCKYNSKKFNLDRFVPILQEHFSELKNIRPTRIEFFSGNDRNTPLDSGEILTNDMTTSRNPLFVRYPFSYSSVVAPYKFGNNKESYVMPHSSGSWILLRGDIIKNFKRLSEFDDVQARDLYFEISDKGNNNKRIENEFQFNDLVEWTEVKNGRRVLPELKVLIKGKKPYSEWNIKEVLSEILHQEYGSLAEWQMFNLDELPMHTSFAEDELRSFVGNIQQTLDTFKEVNINEATTREYISIFMKTAVKHIIVNTNESARLFVKYNLNGSRGYGPVDYLVTLNDIAVLVNEAKVEDIIKGIAQAIMQLHTIKEKLGKRKLDQTDFDQSTASSTIYGIVTTGSTWQFIRWTGSTEKPKVELSKQYLCDFAGDMQSEKEVLSYIVCILQAKDKELKNKSKHPRTEI